MACSPAQLAANQRNSLRSTGPTSDEGKAISRRNGLKHGLTGAGIVLPEEDAEEVDRRLADYEDEFRPRTASERDMAKRAALASIRLDRLALQESKALGYRMRHAIPDFDEARKAEADHLYSWIASEPATNARRLRQSPEGIERLIEGLRGLYREITNPSGSRWDFNHAERFHNLLGLRSTDLPVSRIKALTDASVGNFRFLDPAEGEGLGDHERKNWALRTLADLIADEADALKALLAGFDRASLDRDRAEAPARAMFDDSKEAILARKYEAASERTLLRAIRELREAQASPAQADPDCEITAEPPGELGSLFPETSADDVAEADADSIVLEAEPEAIRERPDLKKLARKRRRRPKVG